MICSRDILNNNLRETLEILKMHYKFNYTIKGKSVIIENFRVNKKGI